MNLTPSGSMTATRIANATSLQVLTNQLYIEPPTDWATLLASYTVWRYQLSSSQAYYARSVAPKKFYERFTNAYKTAFDQPFYYFTFDKPHASLYTLLPHGHTPKPWVFPFGNRSEVIACEQVAPDELQARQPHVILKLMLALCFYETGLKERQQRVCQSKFFMRVKGKETGKFITAIEFKPAVVDVGDGHRMTLKVETGLFVKAVSAQDRSYTETGTYYEQFVSQGQTYLRQIRPDQVEHYKGDLYQPTTIKGRKPQANWHSDGVNFRESRSYLVRHVQERLMQFLIGYGFRVSLAEETLFKHPVESVALPLHRLPTVQVLDNRLNQTGIPFERYIAWLRRYHFLTTDGLVPLPFEGISLDKLDANKPLLVLIDAEADAFGEDEEGNLNLLSAAGFNDPYKVLYQQLPGQVKQSFNVNLNSVDDFAVADHYLTYPLPDTQLRPGTKANKEADAEKQDEAQQMKNLTRNLEVCLSELWLKWVVAGRVDCSPAANCLPFSSLLTDEWGFMTDNLLLYFDKQVVRFANLETPEGKKVLKERFTSAGEIRQQYMARTRYTEERTDTNLPKAHFVLIGMQVLDIECTDVIAMPNWPEVLRIKADEPKTSAKTRQAIGVYAGGIWFNEQTRRYLVSGVDSSKGTEKRGHHLYQAHIYDEQLPVPFATLLALLTVTFVRKNQYTVLPYPFDMIRLYRELNP